MAKRTDPTCDDCGAHVPNRRTKRCRACYLAHKRAQRPECRCGCGENTPSGKWYLDGHNPHIGRVCEHEGCDAPHLARGACRRHYVDPIRRKYRYRHRCTLCGAWTAKPSKAARYSKHYCSHACYVLDMSKDRTDLDWRQCDTCQRWNPRGQQCDRKVCARTRQLGKTVQGGRWWAGYCHDCGDPYIISAARATRSRYCTPRCGKRADKRHRRNHQRITGDGTFSRIKVFTRDAYRCHLCKRKCRTDVTYLHDRYPTIDHLVPVSHGGAHTLANTATACRACNQERSDRGPAQLRLA